MFLLAGDEGQMMPTWTTLLGLAAAALTSLSYIPQAFKAVPRGATDDISLGMLIALFIGLLLWVAYGVSAKDYVVLTANVIGASLVCLVLACKIRDKYVKR